MPARPGGRQANDQTDPDFVQVLDQQVRLARFGAQQLLYAGERYRLHAATFGWLAFSLFGNFEHRYRNDGMFGYRSRLLRFDLRRFLEPRHRYADVELPPGP